MEDQEKKEVTGIIENLENESRSKDGKINELNNALISQSNYGANSDGNLIVYQLEMDNILEKIEHLLKGDIIKSDEEGNMFYTAPTDTGLIVLNEYGVQLIINTISFYLNRNTILSSYDDERIAEILRDLGDELTDLVLCNYQKMGMDSMQKKSRYPILIINVLHIIESAYNRSLAGGERDSLRTGRIVTQNEGSGRAMAMPYAQNKGQKFSVFNPDSW